MTPKTLVKTFLRRTLSSLSSHLCTWSWSSSHSTKRFDAWILILATVYEMGRSMFSSTPVLVKCVEQSIYRQLRKLYSCYNVISAAMFLLWDVRAANSDSKRWTHFQYVALLGHLTYPHLVLNLVLLITLERPIPCHQRISTDTNFKALNSACWLSLLSYSCNHWKLLDMESKRNGNRPFPVAWLVEMTLEWNTLECYVVSRACFDATRVDKIWIHVRSLVRLWSKLGLHTLCMPWLRAERSRILLLYQAWLMRPTTSTHKPTAAFMSHRLGTNSACCSPWKPVKGLTKISHC